MKGVETHMLIAIILLVVAIGVVIAAFYPSIKTSTESQDATSAIASACYEWVTKGCSDEFYNNKEIKNKPLSEWCKQKYGNDPDQAKYRCKQFCQC